MLMGVLGRGKKKAFHGHRPLVNARLSNGRLSLVTDAPFRAGPPQDPPPPGRDVSALTLEVQTCFGSIPTNVNIAGERP